MNVKKAGIIATAAAGVVLVGGGAWAATAIASDEPEPVAVETPTSTPTPEATETPEATPTPDVTPTPTPEVVETPVATEPPAAEPAPPAEPQGFLEIARADLAGWGVQMDDAAIYAAGDRVCAGLAAGQGLPDINAFDGTVGAGVESGFRFIAREHYC